MSWADNIKNWIERSREKHKLSFTDDTTYHEKWSYRLSRFNLWTLLGLYTILIIIGLSLLINYTSVKHMFMDATPAASVEQVNENSKRLDSLNSNIRSRQLYFNDLMKILKGESFDDSLMDNSSDSLLRNYEADFQKSDKDSLLRYKVENQDKVTAADISYDFFSAPVKGTISQSFNKEKGHYGIDVVTKRDAPISACLEGTVIFAGWTPNEGEVVILQHNNNYLSVYKHCSSLLKKTGNQVQTADPLAIVGNSGKHTSGPHLHFEIWQNGTALNPQEFISFDK